jgi:hypothetical protein
MHMSVLALARYLLTGNDCFLWLSLTGMSLVSPVPGRLGSQTVGGVVGGSQWIVDDTVTPAQDSPTMTWLKSMRFDLLRPAASQSKGRLSP